MRFAYRCILKGTQEVSSSADDVRVEKVGSNVNFGQKYGGLWQPIFTVKKNTLAAVPR